MSQGQQLSNGNKVLVAIGGNASSTSGGVRETVAAGLDALREVFGDITTSTFYQTPAFPAGSGPDFVNAACCFHSDLTAAAILQTLHDIEARFGRTRTQRWGQRTLDLDLIAHGQIISPDTATYAHWRDMPLEAQKTQAPDRLILPHPRLQDRAFVLVPLADIAPDWTHPVSKRTVADMLSDLAAEDIRDVSPL